MTLRVLRATSHRDLAVVLLIVVALLLSLLFEASLPGLEPIRLVTAFLFVLYVPGYCLSLALFPRVDDLDNTARIGLSLGLSIAWTPLMVLILDRLPWGLELVPIVLGECAAVLLFLTVAHWRRTRLADGQAYAPRLAWQLLPWWRATPPAEKRTYLVIAAALAVAALSFAWVTGAPSRVETMTEFYMVGRAGMAEDFPRETHVGQEIGVTLGIINRELAETTYRVEAWVTNPWNPGQRQRVAADGPHTVPDGERRELPIKWQMPWGGQAQEIELLLFANDAPDAYRRLRLYVDVEP